MGKPKTTSDWIDIDLDGSIDAAIRKLQKLKKEYPNGRIELGSHSEYGESYEHLRLNFTRGKTPIELEYDKWKAKMEALGELRGAARTFAAEGMEYPRAAEMATLEEELGAWAKSSFRMGWLSIWDGEIVFQDMMRGGYRRDGTWAFRMMGSEDFDDALAQAIETHRDETADAGSVPKG